MSDWKIRFEMATAVGDRHEGHAELGEWFTPEQVGKYAVVQALAQFKVKPADVVELVIVLSR
jgi:hypothetical protein